MTASTATAPRTFEELGAFKTTRVEFPRSVSMPKGERSVRTEWVLAERTLAGGKVEQVVLQFDTRHWPTSKRMTSKVQYFLRSTEPGSVFTVEHWSPFDQVSTLVRSTSVSRYSPKALVTEHDAGLAEIEEHFLGTAMVAEDAFEAYGWAGGQ